MEKSQLFNDNFKPVKIEDKIWSNNDITRWEESRIFNPNQTLQEQLIYTPNFNQHQNDNDADAITKSHLNGIRFSQSQNCIKRTKFYILNNVFDQVLNLYISTLGDLVRIANNKYGFRVLPEQIYVDF